MIHGIDRRGFVAGAAAAAGVMAGGAAPARKPNFIIVLADDLGYGLSLIHI